MTRSGVTRLRPSLAIDDRHHRNPRRRPRALLGPRQASVVRCRPRSPRARSSCSRTCSPTLRRRRDGEHWESARRLHNWRRGNPLHCEAGGCFPLLCGRSSDGSKIGGRQLGRKASFDRSQGAPKGWGWWGRARAAGGPSVGSTLLAAAPKQWHPTLSVSSARQRACIPRAAAWHSSAANEPRATAHNRARKPSFA